MNQNFEHLSREMAQLMDVVSRGQQDLRRAPLSALWNLTSEPLQELLHVQQARSGAKPGRDPKLPVVCQEVVDLREQKSHVDNEMSVCVQKFDQKLEACSLRAAHGYRLLPRSDVHPATTLCRDTSTCSFALLGCQKELQAHHRLEASQFQPAAETFCTLARLFSKCCRSRAGPGERHCINMQILEIQRQLRPWPQRQIRFSGVPKFPSCSVEFWTCIIAGRHSRLMHTPDFPTAAFAHPGCSIFTQASSYWLIGNRIPSNGLLKHVPCSADCSTCSPHPCLTQGLQPIVSYGLLLWLLPTVISTVAPELEL